MDGQASDGCYSREYGEEHAQDEPCSACFVLGGGLGDAEGVDKCVRDKEKELHGVRKRCELMVAGDFGGVWMVNPGAGECILLIWGLPPRCRAHTLKKLKV